MRARGPWWVKTTWAGAHKGDRVAIPLGDVLEYTVTDSSGKAFKHEADNWMVAAASCLAQMDVDVNALGRIVCTPRADGSVVIKDEVAGRSWTISEKPPPPKLRIVASARSKSLPPTNVWNEDEEGGWDDEDETTGVYEKPPPALTMPTSTLAREPVESLAERLFDLSMDLVVAEPEEAMGMALELVAEFVVSDMSIAIRGSLNDEALTVVETRGVVSGDLIGRRIPFGEGLVGTCFDMRETLLVSDVSKSIPYDPQYDADSAVQPRCVLCVPVLDEESLVYGVIELLNSTDRIFVDQDVDAVETIAQTLGQALANR